MAEHAVVPEAKAPAQSKAQTRLAGERQSVPVDAQLLRVGEEGIGILERSDSEPRAPEDFPRIDTLLAQKLDQLCDVPDGYEGAIHRVSLRSLARNDKKKAHVDMARHIRAGQSHGDGKGSPSRGRQGRSPMQDESSGRPEAQMRTMVLVVNGEERTLRVATHETLLEVLRERLDLTGAKLGCNQGECGACTVLIDGEAVLACMTLAVECEDQEILTIEGLEDPTTGALDPLQEAFIEHHGTQCGFCTPGVLMSAKALLARNPNPSEAEIREEIQGNLCRCTGYAPIIEAIQAVAGGGSND
jgi:carbon-monoxide dehydrogenase small subunit